jgi:maleate cis-trans isomerase
MPDETLERYASVYSRMREVQAIEFNGNGGLDVARYNDVMSNLEMGLSDPREIYRMIRAYNSNGNLDGLRQELKKAGEAAEHGH